MNADSAAWLGKGELPNKLSGAYPFPDGDISYDTGGHTNEVVTVAARGAGSSAFLNFEGVYGAGVKLVDDTAINAVMKLASEGPSPIAKHVILMIGDGMHRAHEVAASRYLYGTDDGLRWHQSDFTYRSFCTTWDVGTYNSYAKRLSKPLYDENISRFPGFTFTDA